MQAHGIFHKNTFVAFSSSSSSNARRLVCSPYSHKTSIVAAAATTFGLRVVCTSFTVSDAELESQGFRVHRSPSGIDIPALNDVFARVGFPRHDPVRIRRAMDNAVGAVVWLEGLRNRDDSGGGGGEEEERGGKPVAFARATGDGVFNAVVWDVVVEPSLQGMGLGRAVMERLVAVLRRRGVSNIALYAEPHVVGFYRQLGFSDSNGIKGMIYSRSQKQN